MAKKRSAAPASVVSAPPEDRISSLGFRLIYSGLAAVVLGFIVLWFSDPAGRNWASHLSPFLILGGYGLIGLGILLPEKTA